MEVPVSKECLLIGCITFVFKRGTSFLLIGIFTLAALVYCLLQLYKFVTRSASGSNWL